MSLENRPLAALYPPSPPPIDLRSQLSPGAVCSCLRQRIFKDYWCTNFITYHPFLQIQRVIRYQRLDILPPHTHEYLTFNIYCTLNLKKVIKKQISYNKMQKISFSFQKRVQKESCFWIRQYPYKLPHFCVIIHQVMLFAT